MKKPKPTLKIIVLAVAIFMIGSIANAFVGNPVSSAFADKSIKAYVEQNYSSLDLDIGKSIYNFKEAGYMARAKSKTSVDTHFVIYYRDGNVIRDDYETYVLGKYNTLSRLEEEYAEIVIPILSTVPGLGSNRAMVQVEKWEYEKANETIKLDMVFDKTLPIEMKITIRADLTDVSLKNIANVLESSHEILTNNGCLFTAYDIFSEYDGVLVMISDVTPSDIESGKLEKLLEDAKNYKEPESETGKDKDNKNLMPANSKRIRVFIKDNTTK